jgi:hypothetical protein
MKTLIGAALIAATLALAGSAAIDPAAAASPKAGASRAAASTSSDLGARRHYRRYAYRPADQPYYYGRPVYYRPYPYAAPVPFFLGFGYAPSVW